MHRTFALATLTLALAAGPLQAQDPPPRSVRIGLQMLDQQGVRMPLAAYELLGSSGHEAALDGLLAT
ncbi:MAG: hypothetical protein AAFZ65_18200, partial [Planctomycetota bacterium]